MKIYFFSSRPCALVVGGAYFGKTDTFPRHAEVYAKDELLVEFRPENALPITFFLTEQIRFQPPPRCEVTLLPDGIAIFAKEFIPCDFTLRNFLQEKLNDTLLTVFSQGEMQVCLETPTGTFVKPLPPSFCPNSAQTVGDFYLLSSIDHFCLLDKSAQILLYERCESLSVEGDLLSATLPLPQGKGRKAKCAWRLSEGVRREQFTLLQPAEEKEEGLLAYAFFQSVLLGLEYEQFLGEPLRDKAKELPAFLGDFFDVLPQEEENACGLLYRKADRLYEIKIFRVTTEEGKIVEIEN